jgi:DNA-directed RNA polymerase subunit RPC12/RpoP
MFGNYRFVEQVNTKECKCFCTLCNNEKIVFRQDLVSGKATKCFDCYQKIKNESRENNRKVEREIRCDYCGDIFLRTRHNEKRSHKNVSKNSCLKEECRLEKRKETNLLKRGVEYASQSKNSKEKVVKKWENKTDCDIEIITKKRENSSLHNYGVKNPSQAKEVREKIKETSLLNWDVENPMQNELIKKKVVDAWNAKTEEECEDILKKRISTCIEFHGKYPVNNFGKTQDDIKNWLNSYGFNFQSTWDLIKNREIDLYDSNKKLAIEYCGLYWHNEFSPTPRGRSYHYEKFKVLEAQGIQLVTIFESEWQERNNQCMGHIKATLGISDIKLHGRKCVIKEVSKKEAQQFFDDYHIQGKNSLTIQSFGLFHGEELVGAMSMGRHHRNNNKTKDVVLDRLCFKDNVSVMGGASKLLKSCKEWAKNNGYQRILSFSDNRWSAGKVYRAMNFVLEHESGPDYSFINIKNPREIISKQSQQKKITKCPPGKTEIEWAHERGLARIWDCGKKRWVLDL